MITPHSHRKDEHVSLAQKFYQNQDSFNDLKFIHQGLTDLSINDIDISTKIGTIDLERPFYIEAMTGGSQRTKELNQRIAKIAAQTNLAMAVGSQSVALKDPNVIDTFKIVRQMNPDGIIFANLGAEHSLDDAKRVIDMINADALELHINTLQELIMPEGSREFQFLKNIEKLVNNIPIPIIVKEVGIGMSQSTIKRLKSVGVQFINISGTGGTNFAQIENFRRPNKDMDYLADWGLSTIESLCNTLPYQNDLTVIASGGIKSPLDVAKCLSLGSQAVGIAGFFLNQLFKKDDSQIIETVNDWIYGLKAIMLLTDSINVSDLKKSEKIFSDKLINYLKQQNLQNYIK
ncbi:type 2 isopentenyl-diphosphate Delta-isomerase [Lentilactobacillus laojiaonis]|uniref:type 2 isopentenyl-diphosphate Delta-isomerase n=1 Tax=Lentilactobacillus laojiaonis TaxID=2883998 RepID=UPI001D0B5F6E|nr:type 2 isopentenyl-diphosphate Delta-isomerase [Lentilactobacillus laojiaonis]UDM32735.1 type 2 isopentenyl-diphosphate Delta-isomerase [Lentilactobacillus laojiaonis]